MYTHAQKHTYIHIHTAPTCFAGRQLQLDFDPFHGLLILGQSLRVKSEARNSSHKWHTLHGHVLVRGYKKGWLTNITREQFPVCQQLLSKHGLRQEQAGLTGAAFHGQVQNSVCNGATSALGGLGKSTSFAHRVNRSAFK